MTPKGAMSPIRLEDAMAAARRQPPFLLWYDDSPKHPTAQRIADGAAAYAARFGCAPTLCLVSAGDVMAVEGLEVRAAPTVQRNTYWLGQGEAS